MQKLAVIALFFASTACGQSQPTGIAEHSPAISVTAPEEHEQVQVNSSAISPDPCGPVTQTGYCGVEFGVTPEEALTVLPQTYLLSDGFGYESPETCRYDQITAPQEEMTAYVMVVDLRISRIDFHSTLQRTAEGAGIGSTKSELIAMYPAARTEPHFYSYPDENVIVDLSNGRQYLFELSHEDVVTTWRAGFAEQVAYVEGCS